MKLTITTLTGDKFDVEVKAEDKVKDIKVSTEGQIIKEIDTSFHMLMIIFLCSHCTKTSGGSRISRGWGEGLTLNGRGHQPII